MSELKSLRSRISPKRPHGPADPTEKARLFEHPDLWRAGQMPAGQRSGNEQNLSSGFPELDAHLPGHGWPQSGLSELLLPTAGIGELRLLLPLLREESRKMRWIAWINPPFMPYAPALEAAGVDISKVLVIHPKNHKDALWALERASRSGTCSVALAWLDEQQLALKDTRRLQLAARQGGTLTCLFRPQQAAQQASMAELRLQLDVAEPAGNSGDPATAAAADSLQVSVLKRRGGWPVPDLQLRLPETRSRSEIREQLSLWRFWRERVPGSAADGLPLADMLPAVAETTEQHITH